MNSISKLVTLGAAIPASPRAETGDARPPAADRVTLGASTAAPSVPSVEAMQKSAVIDRLLAPRANAAPPPDAVRIMVHARLSVLPLRVLQAVLDNGARIAAVMPGQTLADVGVLEPRDVDAAFLDLATLKGAAAHAFSAADARYGGQIADAPARSEARANLVVERGNEAWRHIWAVTGGRLDRPFANVGAFGADYDKLFREPTTLERIAELHGCVTSEEKRRYVGQLIALNRELLPQQPAAVPVERRPFVVGDSDFVAPSYHLFRRSPQDAPIAYNGHDYGSLLNWKAGLTRAQYWFAPEHRTLVLDGVQMMTPNAEGIDPVVHEFGHAYEDALCAQDTAFYADFSTQWQDTYDRHARGEGKFPTQYSAYSPEEYFADEFALRMDPRHAAADPEGSRLMDQALERSYHLHP